MLDDPQKRAAIAKKLVRDSLPKRRPSDYDGLDDDGTNSLDGKFFRGKSVRFEVPNTDPVVTRGGYYTLQTHPQGNKFQ